MFGLMTKAKHDAALDYERRLTDRWYDEAAELRKQLDAQTSRADAWAEAATSLQAEIDQLRPLAQKHLNSLAALRQNRKREAA